MLLEADLFHSRKMKRKGESRRRGARVSEAVSSTSSLNIAFLISCGNIGGAQRWVHDQITLLESRHRCLLVAGSAGWLTESCRDKARVVTESALGRFLPKPFRLLQLRRTLIKHNISTLVASSATAGLWARLLAPFLGNRVKVVYVSHGWSALYNKRRFRRAFILIERLLSRFTDLIINVSESDHQKCQNIIKPHTESIRLSNKVLKPREGASKKESNSLKIVFVGRMSHPKRQDLVIEAFKRIDDKNLHLTFIGDGENRQALEQLAGNHPHIHFGGEVPDFNQYDKYDIFCLVSDSEGLPMAALEAKAKGVPLLLSHIGGCPELVSGGNGILCENTPSDIAEKLRVLANELATFTESARQNAHQAWLEPDAEQYIRAYSHR